MPKHPFRKIIYCQPGKIHFSNKSYSLSIRNQYAVDLGNNSIINILTASEFESATANLSGACFIIGKPYNCTIPDTMEAVIFPDFINVDILLESCNHIISEYERFCT